MKFPTIIVRRDVLSSWLTVHDYSQSWLAAELGVSKGRVSQLLTSFQEPSAHLLAKLMAVTELPFERLFRVINAVPELNSFANGTTVTQKVVYPEPSSQETPKRRVKSA